jgi:hypothetical protein
MIQFDVYIYDFKENVVLLTQINFKNKVLKYETTLEIASNIRNYLKNNNELLKGKDFCKLQFPIDYELYKIYLSHHMNCMRLIDEDFENKVLTTEDRNMIINICSDTII